MATRASNWVWTQIADGYQQVSVNSWKHFHDFVFHEMVDYGSYVWRGQRCDNWRLESTLGRLIRDAKVKTAQRHDFLSSHLAKFKLSTRGRRGVNPARMDGDDDWWALGQHHGLATPLLDWTASPFVAAFFAFSDLGAPQTKARAIFAVHQPTVENLAEAQADEKNRKNRQLAADYDAGKKVKLGILGRAMLDMEAGPEVKFIRPLSDENQRLISQAGLFTRVPVGQTIEEWVAANCVHESHQTTLIKILVPDRDRDICLRMLNRMNINHLSLFPDLQGASRYCNVFSEVDNY